MRRRSPTSRGRDGSELGTSRARRRLTCFSSGNFSRVSSTAERVLLLSCSYERNARHFGELGHELILEVAVEHFCCGLLLFAVMPVAATHFCSRFVADSKPGLSEVTHLQIVGSRGAAHSGRHPAWIDGIAQYIGPMPRNRAREGGDIQLAFRVSAARFPATLDPIDVAK